MADQLQREIEDILNKLDEFIPEKKTSRGLRMRLGGSIAGLARSVRRLFSRISLGHLMVASLVLIFIAFIFRSSTIGQFSLIAGLGLLGLTIVISFLTNRRPRGEKRWRGEVVDLSEPSLVDRLQGWFKNRRNR